MGVNCHEAISRKISNNQKLHKTRILTIQMAHFGKSSSRGTEEGKEAALFVCLP